MNTLQRVRKIIRPGDVINTIGENIWYKPVTWVPNLGIQLYQRWVFGSSAMFRDTHTTMYFGDDEVFSTTFPRVKWETLEQRIRMKFTLYRYAWATYTDKHIEIMRSVAKDLIGSDYDVGDLFDIMVCKILGYDSVRRVRLFEFSRKQLVCSTSVRTIQEKLRKTLEREDDFSFKRLFNSLNPDKWTPKQVERFTQTDVEMTTPAHYANSAWYSGEFERVCGWQDFI